MWQLSMKKSLVLFLDILLLVHVLGSCPPDRLLSPRCSCSVISEEEEITINCVELSSTDELTHPGSIYTGWSNDTLQTYYNSVVNITVRRSDLKIINPTEFLNFKNLRNLMIVNSGLQTVQKDFPHALYKLRTLNMSHNAISELSKTVFHNLEELNILDLSDNSLSYISSKVIEIDKLKKPLMVDLSENPWNCTEALLWLAAWKSKVHGNVALLNLDRMLCSNETETFKGRPVVKIMSFLQTMKKECPSRAPYNCSCEIEKIGDKYMTSTQDILPFITVNCSKQKMKDFPEYLPNNTKILDMSNNKISTLKTLVSKEQYKTVSRLYLDNNLLTSVNELEGSNWLLEFSVLSLCGNMLTKLPTYALDDAFRKKNKVRSFRMFLGNNPWKCDCTFTPVFQTWLAKHESQIADVQDIRCAKVSGDDNSMKQIRSLLKVNICRYTGETINTLDLINGVLGALLIIVLGKFAYDCWNYKKTGRLPWISYKLP